MISYLELKHINNTLYASLWTGQGTLTCHLKNHKINSFNLRSTAFRTINMNFIFTQPDKKTLDELKYALDEKMSITTHFSLPVLYETRVCKINWSINTNNYNSIIFICFRILFNIPINSCSWQTTQNSCSEDQTIMSA